MITYEANQMSHKLNVGFIGLGNRGMALLEQVIIPLGVDVVAISDLYEDRVKKGSDLIVKMTGKKPFCSSSYKDVLSFSHLDCVIIASSWESHVDIAVAAMKKGIIPGFEVGGAYSINDCWRLVRTSEETGVPCSMVENCSYGRNELMVLNLVRQGLLGTIVHAEGGYHHDLRDEITMGVENRHYRYRNYLNRDAENYPTHELGPIMNVLDVNHGNRMLSLCSMSSVSASLHEYCASRFGQESEKAKLHWKQGDVVTTMIKCERGETIVLTLDTTLPRYYCRGFNVRGTKGLYEEETHSLYFDGKDISHEWDWSPEFGNEKKYYNDYDHPVWKAYEKSGVIGTHDGIDYLDFDAFFDAVENKKPLPTDVYDSAAMMAITPLSEESILKGGAPVVIPDFTNGKWITRLPWEPYSR